MEIGIIISDGTQERIYSYPCVQLFKYFPLQGMLPVLSRLYLSARKFPYVLELTVSSLSGKDTATFPYYCCNYLYMSHGWSRIDDGKDNAKCSKVICGKGQKSSIRLDQI